MCGTPTVSIITASYNGEKYIHKAIESVIQQDFLAKEYIIVNDCSKDTTGEIIEHYAKQYPWIFSIHNKKNLERAISRNTAIKQAKGKYIAFLDDDDYWTDKQKLTKQIEFLENNPEYNMIGTNVSVINSNYQDTGKYLLIRADDRDIRAHFLKSNQFIFSTMVVKKNDFLKVGGFVDKEFLAEDYELWLKLGQCGKMANLITTPPATWYMERENNTSNTHQFRLEKKALALAWKYHRCYPSSVFTFLSRLLSFIIPQKCYEWKAKIFHR